MSPAPGVSNDESGPPPASPPLPGVPPDIVEHIAETHGAPLPGVPTDVGDHVLGTHSPLLPGVSFDPGHEAASAVPVAEAGEPVTSPGPDDTVRRAHTDDRLGDDRLADDERSATGDAAAGPGAAAGSSDTSDTSRDVPRHRRPDDDSSTHQ